MNMKRNANQWLGFALLAAGCSNGVQGDPPPEDTTNTSDDSTTTVETTTDLDGDGVPDATDDFIDVNGDGIDDRDQDDAVDTDGDGHPDCIPGLRATTQVPRLKNSEYDRTVRDLLGVTGLTESDGVLPSALLATDQTGSLSDLGWNAYQVVGEMITKQVMADATLKAKFLHCDPAQAGCFDEVIDQFGRRAFRRPLNDDEVQRFQALLDPTATANGTPEEVAELLLYGFLISPSFLMRSEISEIAPLSAGYQLSSDEVANRLSYMLWGSMPDPELSEAADLSKLGTKAEILAQAQRMLNDPKAQDMVAEFHREYLHMGVNTRWDTFVKEPTRYPAFNDALRPVLSAETEKFFEEVTFNSGGFSDLFLSTQGFINAETAALYGVDATGLGTELVPKDLPGRPGFLTRLGFLNAFSQASRTSPILRGAFIIKEVLGTEMGTPPPGAGDTPLPDSPDLTTNRARVDAQTSEVGCKKCHQELINPAGFIMEAFDTMGVVQTNEVDTNAPIDTNATVRIDGVNVALSSPAEFMEAIAKSDGARYFYTERWVQKAFGRPPNSQDACTVETLSAKLLSDDYTILDLIAELSQADSFTVRSVETGEAQ
jgi:hypothetical protein